MKVTAKSKTGFDVEVMGSPGCWVLNAGSLGAGFLEVGSLGPEAQFAQVPRHLVLGARSWDGDRWPP